ncbi:hypothetical protein BVRB_4g091310 [Beta vulgaris subsp. vulgaris]|nr:hypothetical protein BVRB_4g091310 [Beta vulgaris subsp. vulgaris]
MAKQQSVPKTVENSQKHNPTKPLLLSDIFLQKNLQKWPIKVNFSGWRKPHQSWPNWVEKLSLKYAKIWELTGICDGILSSLHEIKPNPEIILALSEFWCSKNNTFIFPWGEATITLEDVNVLYGLPVLGETVNFSLFEASSKNMEQKLQQVKDAMSTSSSESDAWINYFNKEKDEIEHVGFLAYWLSMFVFPDLNDRTIGKHGFSVAVHLARGVKIALAPAVLACLYQNLTFITQHAADFDSAKKEVSVPGAFQIVQLWALERFPFLGSKLSKPLSLGHPRIARWDKVSLKSSLVDARKALRSSGDSFCWRPYCSNLENWRHRCFYLDYEKGDVEEVKSFGVFLQPVELFGIDCIEIYQPQRVLKQLGCSQKVIGATAACSPLKSGDSLLKVDNLSKTGDNKLWEKPMSAHKNANNEGLEQDGNDGERKPVIESHVIDKDMNCDEDIHLPESAADISPKSEILNVSGDETVAKQNFYPRDEDQSLEGLIVVDSDEEMTEKLGSKEAIQSRSSTNKLKRRVGDSADYPLYITEYSRKAGKKEKKPGISFGNAIDVEIYSL